MVIYRTKVGIFLMPPGQYDNQQKVSKQLYPSSSSNVFSANGQAHLGRTEEGGGLYGLSELAKPLTDSPTGSRQIPSRTSRARLFECENLVNTVIPNANVLPLSQQMRYLSSIPIHSVCHSLVAGIYKHRFVSSQSKQTHNPCKSKVNTHKARTAPP